jgi:asparagine synthase (glutamine-hydrolysing)
MCGIVGIHGAQKDGWIGRMNAIQQHRGPDDSGLYRDRPAGLALAMRRLAILDIVGGRQPMASADGRHVLVFNGEIFNAPELRAALEARGEHFATDHSDTELLLRLLIRDGRAALPRLNGMFAFAFYDRARGEIFCARDRLGIKPLYYTEQAGRFAFASELKSLMALPYLARDIDRQSLFHYLSLMYVPGEDTILKGVRRLAPGCALTWRMADRTLTLERWWRPEHRPDHACRAGEWPMRIRDTFSAAVRRWSLSDVPIACSLSGGLDSSGIVGALARQGVAVKTFSLGFSGECEDDWNELPLARAVARKWRTAHSELVLDPKSLLDDLGSMVWHLDEPYGGGLPSWLVFKAMAGSVKVGMTGTGGDELFGNYGKWRPFEDPPRWRWSRVREGSGDIDAAAFRHGFFERFYYFRDEDKRAILANGAGNCADTSDMLYERFSMAAGGARDRVAVTDMTTQLPEEFLMMTDRFAMAHSLEARTPFLDNAMVDLALAVPSSLRTDPRDLKGLLRRAVAPLLPRKLRRAPKKGFVIPLTLWLRGPLRPLCEHLLAPSRLRDQGIFDPHAFGERCLRPHLDGAADHINRIWAMLMFQLWHDTFIERNGAAPTATAMAHAG